MDEYWVSRVCSLTSGGPVECVEDVEGCFDHVGGVPGGEPFPGGVYPNRCGGGPLCEQPGRVTLCMSISFKGESASVVFSWETGHHTVPIIAADVKGTRGDTPAPPYRLVVWYASTPHDVRWW